MGNNPSAEEENASSEKSTVGVARRDRSWTTALQVGGRPLKVLDELLLGERRFIANMQTLVDVFYAPLVRWLEQQDGARKGTSCPVSRVDIETVFSNADELIVFSRQLLPALERARAVRSKAMLIVFLQLATSFRVFDVFVAGWKEGTACLARLETIPTVAMFIRACELQERCEGLHLRDFLLMPLQRVVQYRLLVESTSENCPPHLAALQRELAQGLTLPPEVAGEVLLQKSYNGKRCCGPKGRNGDGRVRKTITMPFNGRSAKSIPRPKIKEGSLVKVCYDGPRLVSFVLFSDELHVHTSVEGSARQTKCDQLGRDYANIVPLNRCFIVDGFAAPLQASFVVASANYSFLVQAKDVAKKNEWISALKVGIEGASTARASSTASVTSTSSGGSRGLGTCTKNTASASLKDYVALVAARRGIDGGNVEVSAPPERRDREHGTAAPSSPSSSVVEGGGGVGAGAGQEFAATGFGSTVAADSPSGASSKFPFPSPPPRHAAPSKRRSACKMAVRRRGVAAWKRNRAAVRVGSTKATMAFHSGCPRGGGGGGGGERGGGGGGNPSEGSSSTGGVGGKSREEEREKGTFATEGFSFWLACGSSDKVLRWETLRLDAPLNDGAWSGNAGFRRALADPACFGEFRDLLRARHASENLNFREEVSRFQTLCCQKGEAMPGAVNDGKTAADAARGIVDRFVKQGAPEQVNLSEMGREAILSRQDIVPAEESPPMDLFAEGWIEVSNLLQRDAFMQFRNGEAFLRLKRMWSQELNGVIPASEFVLASDGTTRASEGLAMLALCPPRYPVPPQLGVSETSSTRSSPTTAITERASKSTSSSSSPRNAPPRRRPTSPPPPPPPPPLPPPPLHSPILVGNLLASTSPAVSNGVSAGSACELVSIPAAFPKGEIQAPVACATEPRAATIREGNMTTRETRHKTGSNPTLRCPRSTGGLPGPSGDGGHIRVRKNGESRPFVMPPLPLALSLQNSTPTSSAKRIPPERSSPRVPVAVVANAGGTGTAEDANEGGNGADISVTIPPSKSAEASSVKILGKTSATTVNAAPSGSPFMAPPLPPPRLTSRRRRSSLGPAEAAATDAAIGAQSVAPPYKNAATNFPVSGSIPRTTRTRANGAEPAETAKGMGASTTREKGGEREKREKKKLRGKPPSVVSAGRTLGEESQASNGGYGGRRDSAAAAAAAKRETLKIRYNKVRLLLQASPGNGLGVNLVNKSGKATVSGFRLSPDDNFDPVLAAGLRVGDVLLSVNGLHVLGNFNQALELATRGQENGELSLVVKRTQ